MARAYFIVYFSSRRVLQKLDDARRGRVLLALMDYAEKGNEPQGLDDSESIAFESLRTGIDGDRLRYEERCKTNRASGRKGGRPTFKGENQRVSKKPNGFSKTQDKDKGKDKDEDKYKDSSYRRRPDAVTTTTTGPGEKALAFWADNVGPVGSYLRREVADVMAQGASEDLVLLAMERAIDYGGGRWAYARSILQDARRLGVTNAAGYRASSRPRKAAASGSMKARSGESPKPMKNVFDRDWNAVFDGSPDGSE